MPKLLLSQLFPDYLNVTICLGKKDQCMKNWWWLYFCRASGLTSTYHLVNTAKVGFIPSGTLDTKAHIPTPTWLSPASSTGAGTSPSFPLHKKFPLLVLYHCFYFGIISPFLFPPWYELFIYLLSGISCCWSCSISIDLSHLSHSWVITLQLALVLKYPFFHYLTRYVHNDVTGSLQ